MFIILFLVYNTFFTPYSVILGASYMANIAQFPFDLPMQNPLSIYLYIYIYIYIYMWLGLCRLCQHNFQHNREILFLSIIGKTFRIFLQQTQS